MRLSRAALVILGAAVIGGVAGIFFGEDAARSLARDQPCDALYKGESLKFLDAQARRALVEGLLGSPEVSPAVKRLIEPLRERSLCRP